MAFNTGTVLSDKTSLPLGDEVSSQPTLRSSRRKSPGELYLEVAICNSKLISCFLSIKIMLRELGKSIFDNRVIWGCLDQVLTGSGHTKKAR